MYDIFVINGALYPTYWWLAAHINKNCLALYLLDFISDCGLQKLFYFHNCLMEYDNIAK